MLGKDDEVEYSKRLCPKLEDVADSLILKNAFTNHNERISFGIEIATCSSASCKDPATVSDFLKLVFFNMFKLDE